jgi:hypothetical protein
MENLGHFSNFIKFYIKIIDKKPKIVNFFGLGVEKENFKNLTF